jgi:hypothetical protein
MVLVYISSRTYDARCKNGLGRFLTFPEPARTVLPPHPAPLGGAGCGGRRGGIYPPFRNAGAPGRWDGLTWHWPLNEG